ncbi:MAG TPA: class I SAM-dependent methyltransferase, partial [Acidimicrobiales bacterium]
MAESESEARSEAETSRWRRAVGRVPFLDRWLRRLRRSDEVAALQAHLARLRGTDAEPFLVRWPPGHFYSPVPNMKEIQEHEARIFERPHHLTGLDLNEEAQLALLHTLAPLCDGVTFNTERRPDRRYWTDNPSYSIGDALVLQAMLRHLRPRRYLEIGSGWSTALALDTNDQWLDGSLRITCVEPYPRDLKKLLRPGDDVEVLAVGVQEVELERFADLEAGDILFIDCSHVVKTGSDAHHLITRVLPMVPVGVYIHIHDIFWAFEYPKEWVY